MYKNTIGTPFKSEDPREQRKVDRINKKPWEQEVRDEKGRKRFHGAFTGGFSAGYFNTVGSKEGWAPSNFVSKKGQRFRGSEVTRNVMDYMDEEDITEQIGSHTVTSKDVHKDFSFFEKQEEYQRKLILPENNALLSQILPSFNSTIGNKLMIQAGFDEKRRLNKDSKSDFDMNKYYSGNLNFKDDYYGYGYQKEYDEIMNKRAEKDHSELFPSSNKIRMDRLEEDYDTGFFNSENTNQYNFELVEEEDSDIHRTKKPDIGAIPKFVKADHSLKSTKMIDFDMPKLPKDYDPFLRKKTKNRDSSSYHQKISMNPEKRSELLGDEKNKYLKSKFITVEEMRKKEPEESSNTITKSKPPSATDQITNYFNFKIQIPFKDDLAKVSRFAKFVAEKEGLLIGESYYGNSNLMTAAEIREEKNLFAQLYEDEQKLKKTEEAIKTQIRNNKETDNKEQSKEGTAKSVRDKVKWKPEKLLCKRFKLKDPYENLIEKEDKNKSLNNLQSQILKEESRTRHYSHSHTHHPQSHDKDNKHLSSHDIKASNNEKNSFFIINAKPDVNLFDEIFGD